MAARDDEEVSRARGRAAAREDDEEGEEEQEEEEDEGEEAEVVGSGDEDEGEDAAEEEDEDEEEAEDENDQGGEEGSKAAEPAQEESAEVAAANDAKKEPEKQKSIKRAVKGRGAVRGKKEEEEDETEEEEDQSEDQKKGDKKGPKKPLEPYEVPTSGHFYLHDDRTADKSGDEEESRNVPPPKKKLWSDTGGKWKHDKFDQLQQEEPEDLEDRRSYGRSRNSVGRGRRHDRDDEDADAKPEVDHHEQQGRGARIQSGGIGRGRGGARQEAAAGRGGRAEQSARKQEGGISGRFDARGASHEENFPKLPSNDKHGTERRPFLATDAKVTKQAVRETPPANDEKPTLRSRLEAGAAGGRGGLASGASATRGRGGPGVVRGGSRGSLTSVAQAPSGRVAVTRPAPAEHPVDEGNDWQPAFRAPQGPGGRGGLRTAQRGGRGGGDVDVGGHGRGSGAARGGGGGGGGGTLSDIFAAHEAEQMQHQFVNVLPEKNLNRPSARRTRGGDGNVGAATSTGGGAQGSAGAGGGGGAALGGGSPYNGQQAAAQSQTAPTSASPITPNLAMAPQFTPGSGGAVAAVAPSGQWTQEPYSAWTPQYATAAPAAGAQYYVVVPSADAGSQGTYYFATAAPQTNAIALQQYGYQQQVAVPMTSLPAEAMPFTPSMMTSPPQAMQGGVAPNMMKQPTRRYTQMSFAAQAVPTLPNPTP